MTGGTTSFQGSTAKKITDSPAANTSSEVPKSGCFMIRLTGMASKITATKKSRGRNWPSRF